MIWTNLNLHYLRVLPYKFQLYWSDSFIEEDFLIIPIFFEYFLIISPLDRVWPFVWTNLNLLHPVMLCAKFGWNRSSGSWQEDENVKSLQQRQRQRQRRQRQRQTTDKFWSEKLTWAFGSGELKRKRKFFFFQSYLFLRILTNPQAFIKISAF